MGLELIYDDGQTPLSDEEMEGLLIPSVTTRGNLDEFEQLNIQNAVEFYLIKKKYKTSTILTEKFIYDVHKKMLGDVWGWAGQTRTSEKTIGIKRYLIPTRLKQLLDDCQFWIENETFTPEEISIRFKHELVAIHIFPNVNCRHSRLLGDIMMRNVFKKDSFTWGIKSLIGKSVMRTNYIKALKNADNGNFDDLITFAKS